MVKSPGEFNSKSAFSRARELSIQIKDDTLLFQALAGVWYHHQVVGEAEPAFEVAKKILQLAQNVEDPVRLKFAHFVIAQSLQNLGDLKLCAQHIRQGEGIMGNGRTATSFHVMDAPARWLAVSANAFWQLGYPDQALARSRDALAGRERLSHGFVSAVTRMFCGFFYADCRNIQAAVGHADAGIAVASEYGISPVLPILTMQRGWTLIHLGAIEEGLSHLSQGAAMLQQTVGYGYFLFRRFHIEAYLQAKRPEDGLRLVSEALQDLENGKRRMDHAELYRLKGELLLLENPQAGAEAETCYRAAIEIARRQQAKSWELRSTMSLARLLAAQGRCNEARTMLAEIYSWFTEGFYTPDLKDAQALLEALARDMSQK
jgi:tetratricopeptide (TPR) repeat protein